MAVAINQFFWGMILIFLDINFGIIDILPDFIGYFLIVMAFERLKKEIPKAGKGMTSTWVALVLYVIVRALYTREEWQLFFKIAEGTFQVSLFAMIYYMCEVIHILLGRIGEGSIPKSSSSFEAISYHLTSRVLVSQEMTKDKCSSKQEDIKWIWNAYMYVNLVNIGMSAFVINQVQEVMRLIGIVGVLNLIIIIILIYHLRSIRNVLEDCKLN